MSFSIMCSDIEWVIIIIHIIKYNNLNGEDLTVQTKKSIRKVEKIILFLFVAYLILTYIAIVSVPVIELIFQWAGVDQSGKIIFNQETQIWRIQNVLYYSMKTWLLVLNILIALFQLVIFCFLLRFLKNNLHYYYSTLWKSLFILMFLCEVYFASNILLFLDFPYLISAKRFLINDLEFKLIWTKSKLILWWIVAIATYIPYYFLVFITVRDVNFEIYLKDIMKGARIIEYYPSTTIFVVHNSSVLDEETKTNLLRWYNSSTITLRDNINWSPSASNDSLRIEYISEDTNNSLYKKEYLQWRQEEQKHFQ